MVSVVTSFKSQRNPEIGHFINLFVKSCDNSIVELLNDNEDVDLDGFHITREDKSLVVKSKETTFKLKFQLLMEINKTIMDLNGLCHHLKPDVIQKHKGNYY